jgi:SMODS and SLOG-associating 2TM effector domain 2
MRRILPRLHRNRPDDIKARPIPDLPWKEPNSDSYFEVLFRYVEEDALSALNWYLAKKRQKSRWSKSLRVCVIMLVSAGAIIPIISLITNKRLDPEWALVALAGAASLILFDRAFGYSASWARYLVTSMVLTDTLRKYQLQWAALWASRAPGSIQAGDMQKAIEIITNFSSAVMETVEHETEQWSQDLSEALSELRSRTNSASG